MKTINLRNALINLFCFLILLYPFNSTIASRIYPAYSLIYISVFISLVGLFLLSKNNKLRKKNLLVFFITFLIVIVELVTNKYVSRAKMIIFTVYLFLPFVISLNKDSIKGFKKSIKIFAFEHLFFTYLATLCKGFYSSFVLPFLDSAQTESLASSHFNSGYNPGLTTHYSTNGMYLSIICIYYWAQFLAEKNKKNIIMVLISFIALLLTGKRGHSVFTVISFVIMYFIINKDKIPKRVFKFAIAGLGTIILFYIVSCFLPQVTTVFDRFSKTISSGGDLLTGRGEFYELAFHIWKKNILFGCGWGSFSNYYQIYLFKTFGTSYLDAHNVYIQLLCETGLVGATFIISLMYIIEWKTFRLIKNIKDELKQILYFSFGYQLFFLLYCFSGNPLYDAQCYVMYFICIGIFVIIYMMEMDKNEKNRNINIS